MVTTDAGGSYTGSATLPAVPAGTWLTMTSSSSGGRAGRYETSEFSQCVQVQGGGPGGATPVPTLGNAALALLSACVAGLGALRRRRGV